MDRLNHVGQHLRGADLPTDVHSAPVAQGTGYEDDFRIPSAHPECADAELRHRLCLRLRSSSGSGSGSSSGSGSGSGSGCCSAPTSLRRAAARLAL